MTFAVEIVRQFSTALASLAAIRARKKLGIAIAARIKIMATTTSSSINEKPPAVRLTRHLSGSGSGAGRNNSGESQNQEKGRKSGTSSLWKVQSSYGSAGLVASGVVPSVVKRMTPD